MRAGEMRKWLTIIIKSIIILSAVIGAIIIVLIPLFITLAGKIDWLSLASDPSLNRSLNQAVTWIQVLIAWVTLLFIAIAASQIWLLMRQTSYQRERAEREAYRPLISSEMQSTKRFLNCKEIEKWMEIINKKLAELDEKFPENDSSKRKQRILGAQSILDQTRNAFSNIVQKQNMSFPLLGDNKMSLDHIEALINEYNYLSKLIDDGKLNETFATDLGVDNFKKVYERALPLIKLRRTLSEKYASHFLKYCNQK